MPRKNTDSAALPYRPCVGVMLANRSGLVFVGRRIDSKEGDAWQMPQGGIDAGEDARAAALRELEEETGIAPGKVDIIARSKQDYRYDLPDALAGKLWGGRYRGQEQSWFLTRFTGEDNDINLATAHPEFDAWQWVEADRLVELIVPFKRMVYREVLAEFRELL
jgi:putative (di)nucleoside polyphosphate hydrolase